MSKIMGGEKLKEKDGRVNAMVKKKINALFVNVHT